MSLYLNGCGHFLFNLLFSFQINYNNASFPKQNMTCILNVMLCYDDGHLHMKLKNKIIKFAILIKIIVVTVLSVN